MPPRCRKPGGLTPPGDMMPPRPAAEYIVSTLLRDAACPGLTPPGSMMPPRPTAIR
jgi:hypothetical protein